MLQIHLVPKRSPAGGKPCYTWCKDVPLRRLPRLGWIELIVLPLFGFYPWECVWCQRVSYLRIRGVLRGELMLKREPGGTQDSNARKSSVPWKLCGATPTP